MKFSSSVEIDAPIEKVWALVDKLDEWHTWMPSIKKIEILSDGALGKGTKLLVTAKVSKLTVNLPMTITQLIPKYMVVLEGKTLGTKLIRYYILEPVDGKTKVTTGGDVTGLLARIGRRGGQKISEEIAQAVKHKVESAK